jgi:hypothetical protein
MGKGAHFAGHDRKAFAGLARAGGLDPGVKGKEVGLKRYRIDHIDDLGDFGGRILDLFHGDDGRSMIRPPLLAWPDTSATDPSTSRALPAVVVMLTVTSRMTSEICATDAACCSVRLARSLAAQLISCAPDFTPWAASVIWMTRLLI